MATALDELGDRARAELADLIDRQLCPLGMPALDHLMPAQGETIVDVGCGAGQTVLQLADRVGQAGRVWGVDIAPHVLAVARRRTALRPNVTLLQGDAGRIALSDGSVDAIYSRFGVMGFADPIGAFSLLRRTLRPGGRIAFTCWRPMHENELDRLPFDAAGLDVAVDPTPFRFERPEYTKGVLDAAGFREIAIDSFDAAVSCGDIEATLNVLTTVGALGKVLRENPALLPVARPRVKEALRARGLGPAIQLRAATWVVSAVAA